MGFATVQISHLAMIPELSDIDETRTSLTLIRNTMTAFANILAYVAALIVFSSGKLKYDSSSVGHKHQYTISNCLRILSYSFSTFNMYLGPVSREGQKDSYRNLVIIALSISIVCSMVFHIFTKDTGKLGQKVFPGILALYTKNSSIFLI